MAANDLTFVSRRQLGSEEATCALAHELSLIAASGDWIGLSGDLGAGKTTFARALIQALSNEDGPVEVPSPTFTLVQIYDDCRVPVAHFDLYRLQHASEIDELGMDDIAGNHLVVVEWPERLGDQLPGDRLMIELEISGDTRNAVLTGHSVWRDRLQRLEKVSNFLAENCADCSRRFLQGDASTRRYERLSNSDSTLCILMDMPAKDDPVSAGIGKSYAQKVHLAQDITAVVAINNELRRAGFSAPEVRAVDLDGGLAILEDLGDRVYGSMNDAGEDMSEPLAAAVSVLAEMAGMNWPAGAEANGAVHAVEYYDSEALMAEAELLAEWFWPVAFSKSIPPTAHESYRANWRPLLEMLEDDKAVWVLRDYHSPNLIWLPQREGLSRVGIIDTQDAVLGPAAYDLVSLLQDARVDVSDNVEAEMLTRYIALRCANYPEFVETRFRRSYAILGAQRAAKVLGIFARLSRRDHKHGYLQHIPRVSRALEKNLAHPALGGLKDWFGTHLPAARRDETGGSNI